MAPGGYTTVESSTTSTGERKKWGAAMFTRLSANVGLLRIMAIVNVVAFLVALRIAFAFFTQVPALPKPDLNFSNSCTSSALTSSSHASVEHPVCLILTIGDDTSNPNDKALPFNKLYRLFDAAKEQLLGTSKTSLFVGVDYTSVSCKMARDALQDGGEALTGVKLTCQTPSEVKNTTETVNCGKIIVAKSGQYVTQLTLEWAEMIHYEEMKVIDVDQPDPAKATPILPRELWRPTVTTAFSSNHFVLGCLLMRSIAKSGREAAEAGLYNISIIAFALEEFNSTLQGILDCLVTEIIEEYKIPTEVRRFDLLEYPKWMRINQTKGYNAGFGEYAWKAIVVHEVVAERGLILWTDAGCRMSYEGLIESLNYTRDKGYANRRTEGMVPRYVHSGMLQYLRYVVHYNEPRVFNCDGSAVGLSLDKYSSMVMPWRDCAMTRQCIGPDGSHHGNHRQDQAALTLLADMSGSPCQGISMKIKRHMDNHIQSTAGSLPTKCYKDPLIVITETPEG